MPTFNSTAVMANGTEINIGTWIAGHNGHYVTAMALEEILALGWKPKDRKAIRAIVTIKLTDRDLWTEGDVADVTAALQAAGVSNVRAILGSLTKDEFLDEVYYEAIDWINSQLPEDVLVGMLDGDFGCYPIAAWEVE